MSNILNIVRRVVGDRDSITRQEMAVILQQLPSLAEISTIAGRFADGSLLVGDSHVRPVVADSQENVPPSLKPVDQDATYALEQRVSALVWANLAQGITLVSAFDDCVHYDEPGRLAPGQYAPVIFADAGQPADTIRWLREGYAERVLVVEGPPLPDPKPEPVV